jgi:hypothetical protein
MTNTTKETILNQIDSKFEAMNQKTETQLEGLLWSKPITYWDYIQTDALLSLQTRIDFQNDFVGNATSFVCRKDNDSFFYRKIATD